VKSKKKVFVLLSPGFPESPQDTTCLPFLQNFVRNLRKEYPCLPLFILSFRYPFEVRAYYFEGAKVMSFGSQRGNFLSRKFNWIPIWRYLRNLNKEYKILGILSLWMGECGFIGHYFSKIYKIKHFIWILGQDARSGNPFQKITKPNGFELIAISNFIQDEYQKNYGNRPQYCIPIGIDPNLFPDPPLSKEIDIMGAGSLIPLKQYAYFIRIIKDLKKEFPGLRAIICGNGPEMESLLELRQTLELENNLQILGELPYSDILKWMQGAKVFLHTSEYECFAQVILEALYAGAKVVSLVEPMSIPIENWHILKNKEDMIPSLKHLLSQPNPPRHPVLPFPIKETVKQILALYH